MGQDRKRDDTLDMFRVFKVGRVDRLTDGEGNVIHDVWYVCNRDGIIAYFMHEVDANRFRLAEINRYLNG